MGLLFPGHDRNLAMVDYIQMSQDLKLHYSSLNFVSNRVQKVETVKEIFAKNGGKPSDQSKQPNTGELRKMIQHY